MSGADADDAGRQHARETVVRGPRAEDLAMRRLVREESRLCEDDAQRRGDQQLQPAVAEQNESRDAAAEHDGDEGADAGIEARRPLQKPEFFHDLRHLGVGPSDGWERLRGRVCAADRAEGGRG